MNAVSSIAPACCDTGGGADGAGAGAGAVAAAPLSVAAIALGSPLDVPVESVRISEPSETLSPTLTLSARTVPASGAGTSIVALSDSSVTSGSSGLTRSPALISTSITGTSLKSPMSGTFTSIAADMGTPLGLVFAGS